MTRGDSGKFGQSFTGLSLCFDLDGTLVDTAPDLVRVTNAIIAKEGLSETNYKLARNRVGFGSRRMISEALARGGKTVSQTRLDELQSAFLDLYARSLSYCSAPFPGVIDTLIELRARGARLSVCTNKPGWLARPLLDELSMTHWFETIIGGDEAPAAKPDPRHIYAAAGHRDSTRIVLIGDSWPDMEGARRAGVYPVLVTYGYSPVSPVRLRAGARLRRFRDLIPTLESHFAMAPKCQNRFMA
jgi:phosphoglycolate phosphatase